MRDTRWQARSLAALAALLTAVGEAMAQETRPASRRIVVSIPDCKLAVVQDGRVVRTFRVAVGAAATPSPSGTFTVVRRVSNPTWYGHGKIVPAGKGNPVGTRWIGLSEKGYGIHGTNAPQSIGRHASHGCIRLRNADIEQLFDLVEVGDMVELHDERAPEVAGLFEPVSAAAAVAGGQ